MESSNHEQINFTDFITACLEKEVYLDDTYLNKAFDYLDTNKDGMISKQELGQGIQNEKSELTRDEIDQLLGDIEVDGQGNITYEEFKKMMNRDE
jgi:Ca2+-binding EF-hand superfamily protein